MNRADRIFVAGSSGLVGSSIVRALERDGYLHVLQMTRAELDLREESAVEAYFDAQRPDCVVLAAAKLAGILEINKYPADYLRDNLRIQTNIIHFASKFAVAKLCFIASSAIYPNNISGPITESKLLTGEIEPANEPYAIAKIAGIKMCQAYRRQYGLNCLILVPSNMYGPGGLFDASSSCVIPALISRFSDAKINGDSEVVVWGSGRQLRDFLYVDDFADAVTSLIETYESDQPINVGSGAEISIFELAKIIANVVGYEGKIVFDRNKPEGSPRKLLDISRARELGWRPKTDLRRGVELAYSWYLSQTRVIRKRDHI